MPHRFRIGDRVRVSDDYVWSKAKQVPNVLWEFRVNKSGPEYEYEGVITELIPDLGYASYGVRWDGEDHDWNVDDSCLEYATDPTPTDEEIAEALASIAATAHKKEN